MVLLVANGKVKEFGDEHASRILRRSNTGGWRKLTASEKKKYVKKQGKGEDSKEVVELSKQSTEEAG